jgi:uncharacterized protein YkwD
MIPGRQGTATGGPACLPRRAVDMSPGAPARHRAPRHGAHLPLPEPPPPHRSPPPGPPSSYGPPPDTSYPYGPPPVAPPPYDLPPGGPPRRTRRLSRRARFLLCGLLVLPLLVGVGVYLTRGSVPAPASATGQLAVAPPASVLCDPSAAGSTGSCAAQPFHAAVASVPASLSPRPSAARTRHRHGTPSPSASASAMATAPSPTAPSPTASATSPAGTSSGSAAAQVLALINQARSAGGLAPLTITTGLNSSASAHNSRMAGGCGLSHQCSGEPDLGARETAAGVHWTAAGENIGEGGPVANTTAAIAQMAVGLTQAMLNEKPPDDGHRRNILSSSFTHIGIAVFRDSSGTVWLTQDFSN